MYAVAVDLVPDFFGEIVNLLYGLAMASAQGRQAEWLTGLTDAKVEPPAHVSTVGLRGPAIKRQPDDLLLDVDEAGVCQPLLGDIALQAHRAAEAIHGLHKFIGPLYDVGIPGQSAIVTARAPVYLDLFDIASVRFEMPSDRQRRSSIPDERTHLKISA